MKKLFLVTFLFTVGATAQTSGQPACQQSYLLTNRTTEQTDGITNIAISGGAARTPSINNRASNCNSWLLQVSVDGLTAVSIELDDSQNAYTTNGGTPLAWNAWQGTILSGSNPTTSLSTSALISVTGFYPWISVNLNSSSGTGNIYVTLYGWKTPVLLGQNIGPNGLGYAYVNLSNLSTINHSLLFTDATYDIGASGATRPRNIYASGTLTTGGAATIGGLLNAHGNIAGSNGETFCDSGSGYWSVGSTTSCDTTGGFQLTKLQITSTVFASLGSPSNGTIYYCGDCTISSTCAGSGTGAIAKRLNGTWVCN